MNDLIKDIKASLEGYANDTRIEFARKSYPTKMKVIGVTIPELKTLLIELSNQTRSFNDHEKLELLKLLIDENIFKLQKIAFEYLQTEKNLY